MIVWACVWICLVCFVWWSIDEHELMDLICTHGYVYSMPRREIRASCRCDKKSGIKNLSFLGATILIIFLDWYKDLSHCVSNSNSILFFPLFLTNFFFFSKSFLNHLGLIMKLCKSPDRGFSPCRYRVYQVCRNILLKNLNNFSIIFSVINFLHLFCHRSI